MLHAAGEGTLWFLKAVMALLVAIIKLAIFVVGLYVVALVWLAHLGRRQKVEKHYQRYARSRAHTARFAERYKREGH